MVRVGRVVKSNCYHVFKFIYFLANDAIPESEIAVLEKRIGYVVRKIISKIDVDGDGTVSIKEAISAMRGAWQGKGYKVQNYKRQKTQKRQKR